MDHLNSDFMPLARECIEQAQQRAPQLAGMLALGLETASDHELGGVIDSARAAPSNQVDDPELLECIRETAMSVTFPPAIATGREQFEITLRISPAGADAGAAVAPGRTP